jgi:signal transduction histidine kinase
MKKSSYSHGYLNYFIESERFDEGSDKYEIIKLTPKIDIMSFFGSLFVFCAAFFIITFVIATIIAQNRNSKDIINPIINLKRETEKLTNGELGTMIADKGLGDEVGELARAIENLRLKLADSIYYQQKIDENRSFLISSISHDLKTPVTSIRGYIDGVLEGIANTDEKKLDYLIKAVEKTKSINTMIDDLLLYSKLDLKQMPFKLENVNITGFIHDLILEYSYDFERENKKITSEEKEFSDNVFAQADLEKLKRAVQNIVDNAKKNIKSGGGILLIKHRQTKKTVILEFADNGAGIKQSDLPHIFDRFYRGDAARPNEGSSGLGLAIAKHLIEGMGGRIWAVSPAGGGASFMIALKKQ